MITAIISMIVLSVTPNLITIVAIVLAFIAAALLALEPEDKTIEQAV
jgi:phosphatidylglycerophosphate synthase